MYVVIYVSGGVTRYEPIKNEDQAIGFAMRKNGCVVKAIYPEVKKDA